MYHKHGYQRLQVCQLNVLSNFVFDCCGCVGDIGDGGAGNVFPCLAGAAATGAVEKVVKDFLAVAADRDPT